MCWGVLATLFVGGGGEFKGGGDGPLVVCISPYRARVEASEVRIFSTVSLRCKGHIGGGDGGGEVTVNKRVGTDSTKIYSYNTTRDLFGLSFQADLLPLLQACFHCFLSF